MILDTALSDQSCWEQAKKWDTWRAWSPKRMRGLAELLCAFELALFSADRLAAGSILTGLGESLTPNQRLHTEVESRAPASAWPRYSALLVVTAAGYGPMGRSTKARHSISRSGGSEPLEEGKH